MTVLSVFILVMASLSLLVGIAILTGLWNPFKKIEEASGDDVDKVSAEVKDEVDKIKRMTIGGLFLTVCLSFVSLFFVTNPSWMKRMKEKYGV